jgi:hypothetical protein
MEAPPPGGSLRVRAGAYATQRLRPVRYWTLLRGFARESGWDASARANACIDRAGRPLPWYTYAAIGFLAPRLDTGMRVFEYGSGNSTRWWAAHAGHVTAVEDDPRWYARVRRTLPANVELRHVASGDGAYARAALEGGPYDIVVIDGADRNECAPHAVAALADGGVVVWDNSDWTHLFAPGLGSLINAGFRRLDFVGLGPLNGYGWTTSVFYRPGANCLEI